jgi:hypothetical protein
METPKSNKPNRFVTYIIGIVILFVGIIVILVLIGPSNSGEPLRGKLPVTCIYSVKVIAFEDTNKDGLQSSGEAGISGVNISLQHSLPDKDMQQEQTSTDANGLASLNKDTNCPTDDMLTVNAAAPSGYSATTPLSFGPYPAPEYTPDSLTQAAQNPIPEVIYIGLHKN